LESESSVDVELLLNGEVIHQYKQQRKQFTISHSIVVNPGSSFHIRAKKNGSDSVGNIEVNSIEITADFDNVPENKLKTGKDDYQEREVKCLNNVGIEDWFLEGVTYLKSLDQYGDLIYVIDRMGVERECDRSRFEETDEGDRLVERVYYEDYKVYGQVHMGHIGKVVNSDDIVRYFPFENLMIVDGQVYDDVKDIKELIRMSTGSSSPYVIKIEKNFGNKNDVLSGVT
jgi:hypothetical protein